ncbi:hypothetical protein DMUE_0726 [Dictyocoela muelleri]|nr:hypothetical protein DMUE_0726 [Dictyocoela muelleri]
MIILLIIKILCTSNFHEMTKEQKDKVENITDYNSDMNSNPLSTGFNHKFANPPIEKNKFNIGMTPNTNDLCLHNSDSASISSNIGNNEHKIYASEINSKTKINADNPTKKTPTQHNENHISFYKGYQSDSYNFYKSIKQTSSNQNISSDNHITFERHFYNLNQSFKDDEYYRSVSNIYDDEKYNETAKHLQNEEILRVQNFDYSHQNIFKFNEMATNDDLLEIQRNTGFHEITVDEDLLEIQRNAEFYEIYKLIERDQELIKEKNKFGQNLIQSKRNRNDLSDLNLSIINTFNQSNILVTPRNEVYKIESNLPKPNTDLKNDHNLITTNFNEVLNIKKNARTTISKKVNYNKSQLNFIPISPKNTKQINYLSNIPSTSKTYSLIKKHDIDPACNNEKFSPYDNDFDSTNFSLDFLNFYITDLNEDYLEKCKNIFSVVVDKIFGVLIRLVSENKIQESPKYKTNDTVKYFMKINITIKIMLKEMLGEEIPIYICTNNFINLNDGNLDILGNKNLGYNIFRSNEQESDAFMSLINNIEHRFGNEAKFRALSTYNNFLENLDPDILFIINKINSGQINNKNYFYLNINKVFYKINKLINFTNDQITETEGLIIYKVLKSISKFLKKTSGDSFLSHVFPEFRIINILYHLRIKDHHISGRKFHAGIFLKKILKQKLEDFKDKYKSIQNIDNLDDTYFKEILEIRSFYILHLFKFLNIKKPYLMAYILLSIKSYLLQNEKVNYNEKNDLERIFSVHVLNLHEILDKQVFKFVKPFIK